jgi:hypothetical protein
VPASAGKCQPDESVEQELERKEPTSKAIEKTNFSAVSLLIPMSFTP